MHHLKHLEMCYYAIAVLSTQLGGTSGIFIVSLESLKFISVGDNIYLNCSFSSNAASAFAWFKQRPGEKPLLIASTFQSMPITYNYNGFDKDKSFIVLKEKSSFTLNISNAEASDSATYYCAISNYLNIGLGACTVVILKATHADHHPVLQKTALEFFKPGGNTTLQCSVLTGGCSEDHSVYWFRQGSEESHPGIIYTHGNRDDQCKKSSETDSSTQSCVYKLPKTNLSLSDTGTYYCAVAACGEILFGNKTQLNIAENAVLDPIIIVLAAAVIILMIMVLFLCRKLHNSHHKDAADGHTVQVNQVEDNEALNYAALSFTQPPPSRRSRTKSNSDQAVYAQVKPHQ